MWIEREEVVHCCCDEKKELYDYIERVKKLYNLENVDKIRSDVYCTHMCTTINYNFNWQEMINKGMRVFVSFFIPDIKKVIFNNPATIVYWADGTKTVVKSEGEEFDPEKGLAMAIAKKAFGNEGYYYNEFKKWLPKES